MKVITFDFTDEGNKTSNWFMKRKGLIEVESFHWGQFGLTVWYREIA